MESCLIVFHWLKLISAEFNACNTGRHCMTAMKEQICLKETSSLRCELHCFISCNAFSLSVHFLHATPAPSSSKVTEKEKMIDVHYHLRIVVLRYVLHIVWYGWGEGVLGWFFFRLFGVFFPLVCCGPAFMR